VHCSELFAMPWESLFDSAGATRPLEVPLWSGLRLSAMAQAPGQAETTPAPHFAPAQRLPLKDLEVELIRKAVQDARGNVMQAAQTLGISRATVYRKLGSRKTSV
jgi:DNA-binding NtrC family response regulator